MRLVAIFHNQTRVAHIHAFMTESGVCSQAYQNIFVQHRASVYAEQRSPRVSRCLHSACTAAGGLNALP
jgi:hypothetical protein